MMVIPIQLPLSNEAIEGLKCGDIISLSGTIHTARDQAHKRFCESLERGEALPVELKDTAIYYCGPTPAIDGEIIGSCGPTTSARMDDYTPALIRQGLKIMIGKGKRSPEVIEEMKKFGAVYLVAIGGAGALIKSRVTSCTLCAYNDLGCEAVYKLEVKNLELLVGIDARGNTCLK